MNASAATAALAAAPSTATFGLPATDTPPDRQTATARPGTTRNHHRQGDEMNAARDELAEVVSKALGDVTGIFDTSEDEDHELADAILAAGYSKPRTITTGEELDALALPAIIDSPNGGVAKVEYYAGPGRQKYVEYLFCDDDGGDESYSLKFFAAFGLPAIVLKEGAL